MNDNTDIDMELMAQRLAELTHIIFANAPKIRRLTTLMEDMIDAEVAYQTERTVAIFEGRVPPSRETFFGGCA